MNPRHQRISELLDHLINNEKHAGVPYLNYSQAGIKKLLKHLGDPQKNINTVHIAGTNGKGSVACMIEAIFRENGYKTGLYTSPHLMSVNERIRLNNVPITDRRLVSYIEKLCKAAGDLRITLTYFDVLTAAGFIFFSDMKTDIAIIETGLGGVKDSTNVIKPILSVITPIAKDHQKILGKTLALIAENKSGIIKKNIPVLTSNTKKVVTEVIRKKAVTCNSPFYQLYKHIRLKMLCRNETGTIINISIKDLKLHNVSIPLHGKPQAENAALSVAACKLCAEKGYFFNNALIKKALSELVVPGRFEFLCTSPTVVFDPAHNPSAIKNLLKTLQLKFSSKTITIVLSLMKDKDFISIIKTVNAVQNIRLLYFNLNDPRSLQAHEALNNKSAVVIDRVADNLNDLVKIIKRESAANNIIVFTGSFRLYKTARDAAEILYSCSKNFP